MRFALALLGLSLLAGCSQPHLDEQPASEDKLFAPATMRIHPIFTEVKDWTGDGRPDGVEVLLEFNDRFGDPTKAAGSAMFELYTYRPGEPDPRGRRLLNPWVGSITSESEQRARWNRTSRTYTFQLACPGIALSTNHVLTATFRSATGGRFFDRVVLPAQELPVVPTTAPTTAPATQPAP